MAAVPTVLELQDYLASGGFLTLPLAGSQLLLPLAGVLAGVIDELQDAIGCWPLTYDGTPSTRVLEGRVDDHGKLPLGSGLLAPPTAVTVNGLELAGTTWHVWPRNNPYRGKPYTHLVIGLTTLPYGNWAGTALVTGGPMDVVPPTVEVTGPWGYYPIASVPERVRQALLARAAERVTPLLVAGKVNEGLEESSTTGEGQVSRMSETDPTGAFNIEYETNREQTQAYETSARFWRSGWQREWDQLVNDLKLWNRNRTLRLERPL